MSGWFHHWVGIAPCTTMRESLIQVLKGCSKHLTPQGKHTAWTENREKEYTLKAKLTEKNILALEKGTVDDELGLATPCGLLNKTECDIKAELPSLDKLKEQAKTAKTS